MTIGQDGRLETAITLFHGDLPVRYTTETLYLGTPSHLDRSNRSALSTTVCTQGESDGRWARAHLPTYLPGPVYGHVAPTRTRIWPYGPVYGLMRLYGPVYGLMRLYGPIYRVGQSHMALYTGSDRAIWPCIQGPG